MLAGSGLVATHLALLLGGAPVPADGVRDEEPTTSVTGRVERIGAESDGRVPVAVRPHAQMYFLHRSEPGFEDLLQLLQDAHAGQWVVRCTFRRFSGRIVAVEWADGDEPDASSLHWWFENAGGFRPRHDRAALHRGVVGGLRDLQDESGMSALSLAVMSNWKEGVDDLLRAKADTELRYFRTGSTALYMAVQEGREDIAKALVAAGADPDAPNHWGLTPRDWALQGKLPWFDGVPVRKTALPPPRIQNTEHLADHSPAFQIPDRAEREGLRIGQAVDLVVYGPKAETKGDRVKVRITAITGSRPHPRYTGTVETPIERTHLAAGTTVVTFGPENVATVYVAALAPRVR